jgi:hypothetical protein
MRTTIDIPDGLYRRLKAKAASEGKPAKALILKAVEQVLSAPPAAKRKIVIPVIRSKNPGSMKLDNQRIYDLLSFP